MIILKRIQTILGNIMWITFNWVRTGPNKMTVFEKQIMQAYFQVSVTEFLDHFFYGRPWVTR
jgi:hypothetical protein